MQAFRALRNVQYRWYWFSGLGMTAAQGVQQLAMAWLVLDLTGSVGQLGLVIFFQGLPMAMASLYGGVLADRYNRRMLLLFAQTFTMFNLLVLAVLTMADLIAIWQVYLSSFGLGLMMAVTMPARQALIANIVRGEDTLNAVTLNAIQFHSSRIIWPSLAGTMIAVAGIGATLLLSAFFSLCGLLFLAMMRIQAQVAPASARQGQIKELREGVRYAFATPGVSTIMKLGLACGLFGLAYMNLAPAFAREELDLGSRGAGFFIMSMGIGAIIGSIWLLAFPSRDDLRAFVVLMAAFALVILAQALNPVLAVAFLIMGLFGAVSAVLVVAGQTYLQTTVPQGYLGRVVGLWSFVGGLASVTALPIGVIGDEFGLRYALGGASTILLLLTLWIGAVTPRVPAAVRETEAEVAAS